ncbi:hypothetical protein BaRGS_00007743, partial [Batillaria attramentaria]
LTAARCVFVDRPQTRCDIRNSEDVRRGIEGADVVYHMASYGMSGREQVGVNIVSYSRTTVQNYFSTNEKGRGRGALNGQVLNKRRVCNLISGRNIPGEEQTQPSFCGSENEGE